MKELDKFEKQIEEELEKGEWKRIKNFEEVKAKLQDTAKAPLQEEKCRNRNTIPNSNICINKTVC